MDGYVEHNHVLELVNPLALSADGFCDVVRQVKLINMAVQLTPLALDEDAVVAGVATAAAEVAAAAAEVAGVLPLLMFPIPLKLHALVP